MAASRNIFGALGFLALFFLSGCITPVTTPGFARTGDVVNLNLGGFKRNLDGQALAISDLNVTLTNVATTDTYTPEILGIFRAYPDYGSIYSVSTSDRNDVTFGGLYPNDGAVWLSIRLTSDPSTVLPLSEGAHSIDISSPKLTQTGETFEGQYSNIPIEILPGVGTPSVWDRPYEVFKSYDYLTIRPDPNGASFTGPVGGMQIKLVVDASLTAGDPTEMFVFPLHHDPNMNLIQSVVDNGDGTKTLTAMLTNPNGFVPVNTWAQGMSTDADLELGITSSAGGVGEVPNAQLSNSFTIITTESFYVDLDGNAIADPAPTLTNEFL